MELYFLMGFSGGVIRAIVGLIKYSQRYKNITFKPYYLLGTILLSGIIGLACAWIVKDLGITFLEEADIPLSIFLIIGYAGGDLIDNLFKIVLKDADFSLEKLKDLFLKFFKKND